MVISKQMVYNLIKEKPNTYNSVELGRVFNTSPDDVRAFIRDINQDTDTFEYGIISINHKYLLATEGEHFKTKVMHYRQMHKTATKQEQLWLKRQDKVLFKKQDGHQSAGELLLEPMEVENE